MQCIVLARSCSLFILAVEPIASAELRDQHVSLGLNVGTISAESRGPLSELVLGLNIFKINKVFYTE